MPSLTVITAGRPNSKSSSLPRYSRRARPPRPSTSMPFRPVTHRPPSAGASRPAGRVRRLSPRLVVTGAGRLVAEQQQVVALAGLGAPAGLGRDLAGGGDRAPLAAVGLQQHRPASAQGEGVAQLLGGGRRPQPEHRHGSAPPP